MACGGPIKPTLFGYLNARYHQPEADGVGYRQQGPNKKSTVAEAAQDLRAKPQTNTAGKEGN